MRQINSEEILSVTGGDAVSHDAGYGIGYAIGYVLGGGAGRDLGYWLYDTING